MTSDSRAFSDLLRIVYLGERCAEAFDGLDPSVIVLTDLPSETAGDLDAIFVEVETAEAANQVADLTEHRPDSAVITIGEAGDSEVTDACFDAGTNGHFELPFDTDTLIGILAAVTGRPTDTGASGAEANVGDPADPPAAPDDPVRVLVVDDDEFICEAMVEMLEMLQASVVACSTRAGAVEALAGSDFDLVLLDSRMPDLTEERVLDSIPSIGESTIVALMSGIPRTPPPGTIFLPKPLTLVDIRVLVASAEEMKDRLRCRT